MPVHLRGTQILGVVCLGPNRGIDKCFGRDREHGDLNSSEQQNAATNITMNTAFPQAFPLPVAAVCFCST